MGKKMMHIGLEKARLAGMYSFQAVPERTEKIAA